MNFRDIFAESYCQTFDDTGAGRKDLVRLMPLKDAKEDILTALNQSGSGIFFTPNPCKGGRTEKHVTQIKWLYVDMDSGTKEEMQARIKKSPIVPHIIIESKRGYHLYWRANLTREEFDEIIPRLIHFYEGDPAISSINEVLRFPGYFHMKDPENPFEVKVIFQKSEIQPISADKFTQGYPSTPENKKPLTSPKNSVQKDSSMERVKQIPILEVLSKLGVEVRNNFIWQNGEQTSAHVNVSGNYVNRFSGKDGSGSTIDVVMTFGGMDIGRAVEWLKEKWAISDAELILDQEEDIDEIEVINKPFTWGTPELDRIMSPIQPDSFVVFAGTGGAGKCFGKGTMVLMYDGTVKNVEDIRVGEEVMGDDSTPRKVLSLGRGREQMYKIKQRFGCDYRVNKSHILSLETGWKGGLFYGGARVNKVDIPLTEYLAQNKTFKSMANGYKEPVEYKHKYVKVDPYILGVWLGDGCTKSAKFTISDKKQPIKDELYRYAEIIDHKVTIQYERGACETLGITTGQPGNPLKPSLQKWLNELGVIGNKHIPTDYLINSREVRLQLLAGILDTDGYLDRNQVDIVQKKKDLALGIKRLADSLGFRTKLTKCTKGIKSKGFIGEYWRLYISGDFNCVPFRYQKPNKWTSHRGWRRTSIVVEKDIVDDYYGFVLDGNHRFLLEDGTVVHNTAYTFNMAEENAKLGHKVLYISLEMNTGAILTRVGRDAAGITKEQWRDKTLISEDQKKVYLRVKAELRAMKNLIPAGFPPGIDPTIKKIRELIHSVNPDIVILDNFDLIKKDLLDSENRSESKLAMQLMNLAKQTPVPIVVIHHVRKGQDSDIYKPGNMNSIKGSSKIVHDADIVMIGFRKPPEEGMTKAERARFTIIQVKDRDFGKGGYCNIYYDKGKFSDIKPQDDLELAKSVFYGK